MPDISTNFLTSIHENDERAVCNYETLPSLPTQKSKNVSKIEVIVTQHIEMAQLGPTFILLCAQWLFFQLNFGAKIFEIGDFILELW